MKRFVHAILVSTLVTCQAAWSAPYCAALTDVDALPKAYQKRGPFYSDTETAWIVGADQLAPNFAMEPEAAFLLSEIVKAFKLAGTELVALSAPPRPFFVPQGDLAATGLPQTYAQQDVAQAFKAYIASLNAAGVPAPDLSRIAETDSAPDYYFQRDTHWTPYGAYLSAHALAETLAVPAPTIPPFTETFAEKGSLSAVVEKVCGTRPAAETVPAPLYAKEGALLGDSDRGQVALVGTSFSDRYKRDAYQVAEALSHVLDKDVLNMSLTGGGLTGAMVAFLSDPALDLSAFDYVVWETPYTAPLTNTAALRYVLGHLTERMSRGRSELATFGMTDNWENLRIGFDATEFAALSLTLPGVEVGHVSIELISETGDKQRYKLTKSARVPTEHRTDRWALALTGLPNPNIERLKIKVSKPGDLGQGTVTLLK